MRIELISKKQFDFINGVQKKYPVLTFQNKGYEEIKEELTKEESLAKENVAKILKEHIDGFSRFQNFKFNKNNELMLRFQYNYNYDNNMVPFIGVGYILLDELLNGFKEQK